MKTATITFHAPNNNGSFLQAFALQKYLKLHFEGVENDIIDFQPISQQQQYAVFRKIYSKMDFVRNVIAGVHYCDLTKRAKRFSEMREEFLQMTELCTVEQEALEIAARYDLIIAGSDQIWNTTARDFSQAYLLPGIQNKAMYAVSCGSHLSEVDVYEVCNAMLSFKNLSVREDNTRRFLESHSGRKVEMVLDPTFLLDKEDYAELYKKTRIIKEKYIFLYTINYDKEVIKQAVQLSKNIGKVKIITPFTGYSAIKAQRFGIKVLWDVAPDTFLNLIENAECVCTNSFHGIAFSIIFKKDFYRLGSIDQVGNIKKDDRIDNILKLCGLENRNYHGFVKEKCNTPIDYASVTNSLEKLRKTSDKYIYDMLMKK